MYGISIIICSKNGFLEDELVENIKTTIGSEYEIIVIDNSKNKYSIFEAYNIGIKNSIFPYLLFVHEDVLFHSQSWGEILISYFNNDLKLGLIGIAGSKTKEKIPSTWWDNNKKFLYQNILHHYPNNEIKHEILGFKDKSTLEEVVVIDGVFIAMRKDISIKFDEKLKGFHNYDLSISLQFRQKGYKVCVTKEILLEHFSLGKIDESWVKSSIEFHHLYRKDLPQYSSEKSSRKDKAFVLFRFIDYCRSTGNRKLAFLTWLKYLKLVPFSKNNTKIFFYFLKGWYKGSFKFKS